MPQFISHQTTKITPQQFYSFTRTAFVHEGQSLRLSTTIYLPRIAVPCRYLFIPLSSPFWDKVEPLPSDPSRVNARFPQELEPEPLPHALRSHALHGRHAVLQQIIPPNLQRKKKKRTRAASEDTRHSALMFLHVLRTWKKTLLCSWSLHLYKTPQTEEQEIRHVLCAQGWAITK